jgi:hypothetical protein
MYICIICNHTTATDDTVIVGVLRQCVCRRCDDRIMGAGRPSAATPSAGGYQRHMSTPHREEIGSRRR